MLLDVWNSEFEFSIFDESTNLRNDTKKSLTGSVRTPIAKSIEVTLDYVELKQKQISRVIIYIIVSYGTSYSIQKRSSYNIVLLFRFLHSLGLACFLTIPLVVAGAPFHSLVVVARLLVGANESITPSAPIDPRMKPTFGKHPLPAPHHVGCPSY